MARAFCHAYRPDSGVPHALSVQEAMQAALADVPDVQLALEQAFRSAEQHRLLQAHQKRIRELEDKLAEAREAGMEEPATDDTPHPLDVAVALTDALMRANAAEAKLAKVRAWRREMLEGPGTARPDWLLLDGILDDRVARLPEEAP
jgi:hypothetical protein